MIDSLVMPLQRRLLVWPARWLADLGIRADQITFAGFAVGVAGVFTLAGGHYVLALALILLNRLFDGLDGAVARITQPTDRGAFLDTALDFVLYALVPLGFALADPATNALPAAVLLAAFVGSGSTFLGFAAIAAKRGLASSTFPTKGIYYLGGLTEGFETIAFFVATLLFPAAFPGLAYGFAAACVITAITRCYRGWQTFSGPSPDELTRQNPSCDVTPRRTGRKIEHPRTGR